MQKSFENFRNETKNVPILENLHFNLFVKRNIIKLKTKSTFFWKLWFLVVLFLYVLVT